MRTSPVCSASTRAYICTWEAAAGMRLLSNWVVRSEIRPSDHICTWEAATVMATAPSEMEASSLCFSPAGQLRVGTKLDKGAMSTTTAAVPHRLFPKQRRLPLLRSATVPLTSARRNDRRGQIHGFDAEVRLC